MLTTPRRGISYPNPDRSDRPDVPTHIYNVAIADDGAVIYDQGTAASRGTAIHQTSGGRLWWETDTDLLWYDDGTSWYSVGVNPNGSLAFTGSTSQITFFGESAVGNTILNSRISGDAGDRLNINAGGTISWGPGTGATDTVLFRSGVNALNINGALTVAGALSSGSTLSTSANLSLTGGTSALNIRSATTATTGVIHAKIAADTNDRWQIDASGAMQWGPGGATLPDTNFYRSAAGVLKTDGSMYFGSTASVAFTTGVSIFNNGAVQVTRAASGSSVFLGAVNGEAQPRIVILSDGSIQFGTGGASAPDTKLFWDGTGFMALAKITTPANGAALLFGEQLGVVGEAVRAGYLASNAYYDTGTWYMSSPSSGLPAWRTLVGGTANDAFAISRGTGSPITWTTVFTVSSGATTSYIPLLSNDGTTSMRVHRHPYTNHRHIETGQVAIGNAPASVSITFTDAFAATPAVIAMGGSPGGGLYRSAVSTTGATIGSWTAASMSASTIHWYAEGNDT